MGRSQEALVILTKKSKLKRKRKYLVTLIQVDPILLVLELPWEKREQAGQCWWDKTGPGRGEPMRTGGRATTICWRQILPTCPYNNPRS